MSLPQIRDEHHVPARLGQKVAVWVPQIATYQGVITGSHDGMILAKFDGLPSEQIVHPNRITFLKG